MTTVSLDTNLIVSLLNQEVELCDRAMAAINHARETSRLVISGVVYAELMAGPLRDEATLDHFLSDTGIEVDWEMEEAIWCEAGRAYSGYALRRRTSGSEPPRRILADFLIGAHALVRGYSLISIDYRHFAAAFPALNVIAV